MKGLLGAAVGVPSALNALGARFSCFCFFKNCFSVIPAWTPNQTSQSSVFRAIALVSYQDLGMCVPFAAQNSLDANAAKATLASILSVSLTV